MRAVMAGGDAVGIATTIDPAAPKATTTVERKSPPFSAGSLLARSARGRDARGIGLEDCRKDSIDGMIGAWPSVETAPLPSRRLPLQVADPKRFMVFASLLAEFDLRRMRHLGGGH
jgi:hypothetical protein